MKRILPYFLIYVLSISTVTNSLAQKDSVEPSCSMCKYGSHNHENPYKKGFRAEVPFIAASAASLTFGFLMHSTNSTVPYSEGELGFLDRNDVNAFDRPATYYWNTRAQRASDILRTGVIILPIIFLSNHHTRSDFGSLLIMGLEVTAITYGLTNGIKHIVNRTRPLVYNENAPLDERTNSVSRLSYFSGHTSITASFSFFIAKVMNDYHPNMKVGYKIAMWSFAAAIPAATGYLRVKGGRHFPTDVISGYALGAFVGWVIPELHKKKKLSKNLSVVPSFSYGSKGIYLQYRF